MFVVLFFFICGRLVFWQVGIGIFLLWYMYIVLWNCTPHFTLLTMSTKTFSTPIAYKVVIYTKNTILFIFSFYVQSSNQTGARESQLEYNEINNLTINNSTITFQSYLDNFGPAFCCVKISDIQ